MTDTPTGPEWFSEATRYIDAAASSDEGLTRQERMLEAALAQAAATQANTAMLAALVTAVSPDGCEPYEIEAWRDVIPLSPLKECKGKEIRRPACEERHTDDCRYVDPIPEPKHVLLPVGTRVLVSDLVYNEETRKPERENPQAGRISGHAADNHKYRWQYEFEPGIYSDHDRFAFADNRVEVHPDGRACPPHPRTVKREPTGTRVYVQDRRGKQGYLTDVYHHEKDGSLWYTVQFLRSGAEPVRKNADSLTIIAESQVERCPNGQTPDDCGSGENQCELCLADEDAEAEAIEESMGLRTGPCSPGCPVIKHRH